MSDRAETATRPRDRSSKEIRREIDRTRAEMDETLGALTRRIRPGSLAGELWERVKGEGGLGDVVREHPVPLAFMGLGLGWLAVEEATADTGAGGSQQALRPGPRDPVRTSDDSARSAGRRAEEGAREAASAARDVTRRVSDAAGEARQRTARTMAHAGQEVRENARKLSGRAADVAENNPLALGAVAFGLGLLGGLVFPTSRAEDRAVGPVADRVKQEGGRLARETADRAADVAGEAAGAAAETAAEGASEAAGTLERQADRAAERVRERSGGEDASGERQGSERERPEG